MAEVTGFSIDINTQGALTKSKTLRKELGTLSGSVTRLRNNFKKSFTTLNLGNVNRSVGALTKRIEAAIVATQTILNTWKAVQAQIILTTQAVVNYSAAAKAAGGAAALTPVGRGRGRGGRGGAAPPIIPISTVSAPAPSPTPRPTPRTPSGGGAGVAKNLRATASAANAADLSFTRLRASSVTLAASLAGIGVAVGLTSLIRDLRDFELSISSIKAVITEFGTDSTDAVAVLELRMEGLTKTARRLGATTVFTAKEAADGMKLLSLAGFSASETIDAIPGVLNAAIAGHLDLATAADFTASILRQFSLDASEATDVADVLAKTATSANTTFREMGEAFKFVGPAAQNVNQTLADTAAAIGILGNAGIKSSIAGTALRRILVGLTEQGNKLQLIKFGIDPIKVDPRWNRLIDIFKELNRSGLDLEKAVALFEQRGGPAALALSTMIGPLEALTRESNEAAGAAEEMANIMKDNLAGDLRILHSVITETILLMGEKGLTGTMRDLTQNITNVVRALAGLISPLDSANKNFFLIAEAIKAFGQAVLIFFGGKIFLGIAKVLYGIVEALYGVYRAIRLARAGTLAWGVALKAIRLNPLITGLTLAVAAYQFFTRTTDEATVSQERFNEVVARSNRTIELQDAAPTHAKPEGLPQLREDKKLLEDELAALDKLNTEKLARIDEIRAAGKAALDNKIAAFEDIERLNEALLNRKPEDDLPKMLFDLTVAKLANKAFGAQMLFFLKEEERLQKEITESIKRSGMRGDEIPMQLPVGDDAVDSLSQRLVQINARIAEAERIRDSLAGRDQADQVLADTIVSPVTKDLQALLDKAKQSNDDTIAALVDFRRHVENPLNLIDSTVQKTLRQAGFDERAEEIIARTKKELEQLAISRDLLQRQADSLPDNAITSDVERIQRRISSTELKTFFSEKALKDLEEYRESLRKTGEEMGQLEEREKSIKDLENDMKKALDNSFSIRDKTVAQYMRLNEVIDGVNISKEALIRVITRLYPELDAEATAVAVIAREMANQDAQQAVTLEAQTQRIAEAGANAKRLGLDPIRRGLFDFVQDLGSFTERVAESVSTLAASLSDALVGVITEPENALENLRALGVEVLEELTRRLVVEPLITAAASAVGAGQLLTPDPSAEVANIALNALVLDSKTNLTVQGVHSSLLTSIDITMKALLTQLGGEGLLDKVIDLGSTTPASESGRGRLGGGGGVSGKVLIDDVATGPFDKFLLRLSEIGETIRDGFLDLIGKGEKSPFTAAGPAGMLLPKGIVPEENQEAESLGKAFLNKISSMFDSVSGTISEAASTLGGSILSVLQGAGSILQGLGTAVAGAVSQLISAVIAMIVKAAASLAGFFGQGGLVRAGGAAVAVGLGAFVGAPAFDGGGMVRGARPVPIIAHEDEAVIPAKNGRIPIVNKNGQLMVALPGGRTLPTDLAGVASFASGGLVSGMSPNGGFGGGGDTEFHLNLTQTSGEPMTVKQTKPPQKRGLRTDFYGELSVADSRRGGPGSKAIEQRFNLQRSIREV